MANPLNSFDIEQNFWEVNPELKLPFSTLHKHDKTPNKAYTSKVMWAISLLLHPDSKFANLDLESRKDLIANEMDLHTPTTTFKWSKYDDEMELYTRLVLTKAQKFLIDWEQKLEERNHFINQIDYNAETYEMLDKMMKETKKMWDQYQQCLKDVEDEKAKSQGRGGAQESASEQKLL